MPDYLARTQLGYQKDCGRGSLTWCVDLKDETLHIRIAAVDAPENAHFGNPAQPFAKESWDWMKALLTGKRVKVQLIRKDQYLRIVSGPSSCSYLAPRSGMLV